MPVHLICQQCGSDYKVPPSVAVQSKYCGHRCYWKSRQKDPAITTYIDSQCAVCGVTFSSKWDATTGRRPECCSHACAIKHRSIRAAERSPQVACHTCGKSFKAFPKDVKRGRKYCSYACMGAAKKQDPSVPTYVDHPCAACGQVFRARWDAAHERHRPCCSARCRGKLHGERTKGENNPGYKPRVPCVCHHCGKAFTKFPCRVHTARGTGHDFCSPHCLHVWNHGARKARTSIEIRMAELLKGAGIGFAEQVPMYQRWIVDFVVESAHLVIFCDGKYWHDRPRIADKDRGQTNYLRKCGWQVLRFTDDQINHEPDTCLKAIRQALNRKGS